VRRGHWYRSIVARPLVHAPRRWPPVGRHGIGRARRRVVDQPAPPMRTCDSIPGQAGVGVRWGRGAHLSAPLFSAAASASHSRRQSAAASPVIIRLTPARMNRGPRPTFHSEYRKLRLMRCALQNSATVNAIGPGGPADSDPLLSGSVLLWRCGACSNDKLRLHLRKKNTLGVTNHF
jgi:hypothetical protein